LPETSIGTDSLLAKSASDLSPDDINTVFIEVILPLALPNTFTYRVPNNLIDQVEIGKRVEVQFGKQKVYSALVATIKNTPPKDYQVKYINTVLDETPIVTESQLQFWQWIAEYYMCTIGEVMNAALPSGLKLSSETRILMNPDFDIDHEGRILDDKEFMVAEALDLQEELSIKDISAILNIKTVYPIVKSLLQKKVVIVEEELIEKYKPKVVSYIGLAEEYKDTGPSFNVLALGAVQTEMLEKAFPDFKAPTTALEIADYIFNFALNGNKHYNGKLLQVSNSTP